MWEDLARVCWNVCLAFGFLLLFFFISLSLSVSVRWRNSIWNCLNHGLFNSFFFFFFLLPSPFFKKKNTKTQTARVRTRPEVSGNLGPYYEYRDSAMSRTAPFKPEWIKELRYVADNNAANPHVV